MSIISNIDFSAITRFSSGVFEKVPSTAVIKIPHYTGTLENTTEKLYCSSDSVYGVRYSGGEFTLVD